MFLKVFILLQGETNRLAGSVGEGRCLHLHWQTRGDFFFPQSNKARYSRATVNTQKMHVAYFSLDFNRSAGRCKIIALFYRYLLDSVDLITH